MQARTAAEAARGALRRGCTAPVTGGGAPLPRCGRCGSRCTGSGAWPRGRAAGHRARGGRGGGRVMVGASPGGRGRDLGREPGRAELPAGQGRLLPRRSPRRRRRPLGRRARLDDRVVLPARLPRSRPAAAHPQRDPESRPGQPTASGARIDSKAMHRYKPAARRGRRAGDGTAPGRVARGASSTMRPDGKAREIVGIDQAVMDLFSSRPQAITKKTASAGAPRSRPSSAGSRTPGTATGCSGRRRWPPARRSPTTARPSSSGWSGGTPSCAPRSRRPRAVADRSRPPP